MIRKALGMLTLASLLAAFAARAADAAPDYDLVLSGGRIVNGTGAPWFRADVGIQGDRIAAVGDLSQAVAARRIDVRERMIAPGFIDLLGQSELTVLIDNRAESKIRQGITTEICGEGMSVAPTNDLLLAEDRPWRERHHLEVDWRDLEGYFRRFRATGSTVNFGTFVGAATVRALVLGLGDVQPTPAQLAEMEHITEQAMLQGALGVSSALIYPPGSYAATPELIALARVAARHGGIYITHMRSEGSGILNALEEAIAIGREARIPVEIWHLKVAGRRNWGRMEEVLTRIERARAEGLDITANMYPYAASGNSLDADIPDWAHAGGVNSMIARIRDPAQHEQIRAEVEGRSGFFPADILLVRCISPDLKPYMGMRLDAAAARMGRSPSDALLDLVVSDRANVSVVRFSMSEEDVQLALRRPWVAFDTDASARAIDGPLGGSLTHPRAFGAAPRVLGHYARDLKLFSVEEGVRKMTSLPARRVGLMDRGILRPGMAADLVVFDPETVRDLATFEDPLQYPEGIETVVVNGRVVLDEGRLTSERPGRVLSRALAGPAASDRAP